MKILMKNANRNATETNASAMNSVPVSRVIYDDGDKDRQLILSPMYLRNGEFFSDPTFLRITIDECNGEYTCRLDNREKNIHKVIEFDFDGPENIITNVVEMYKAGLNYQAAFQVAILIASDMITDLADRAIAFREALTEVSYRYSMADETVTKLNNAIKNNESK